MAGVAEPGPSCPRHGEVVPLWRPAEVGYAAFAEVLRLAEPVPTYLPWPMSPGWSVADVGAVSPGGEDASGPGRATVTRTVGSTDPDGPVEVTVVSEDPGVGLGARCAGVATVDPGERLIADAPAIRVRAEGRAVPLWSLDTDDADPLTRSVFTGEADGRWLWLVVRPASAALLMRDEWLLADVTGIGPEALEMPFGGDRGEW